MQPIHANFPLTLHIPGFRLSNLSIAYCQHASLAALGESVQYTIINALSALFAPPQTGGHFVTDTASYVFAPRQSSTRTQPETIIRDARQRQL